MTKKTIITILSVFLLSVIIRIPNLNRPLSKHHEFNTAFFLIPMEIWYQTSGFDYNFSPVLNYQNKADKGINNFLGEDTEKNGNYYYLSFGPGAYLFPYIFLSAFGVPSIIGLQIFSLFIHLLCALILIKIAHWFLEKNQLETKYSVWIGVVYLFLPITLWFHGNGYTHHSLVVLFYLGAFYSYLKLEESKVLGIYHIYLFIFLFLGIYTEWITCFLAFVFLIFSLFIKKYSLVIICLSVVLLSVSLIVYQYSSLIGFEKYLDYLNERFLVRNNLRTNGITYFSFLIKMGYWYLVAFGCFIFIFIYLLIISLRNRKLFFKKYFLAVFSLPIVMHHLIFPEFTFSHDYSVLIDASFLSIITMMLFVKNESISFKLRIVFIGVIFIGVVGQYYFINRPGEISQRGDRYDTFQKIGEYISKNAKRNEVVVLKGIHDLPNPQIVFYSKRNFYSIKTYRELFILKEKKTIKNIFYCEIQNDQILGSKHLK